jgi:hypothetical protein
MHRAEPEGEDRELHQCLLIAFIFLLNEPRSSVVLYIDNKAFQTVICCLRSTYRSISASNTLCLESSS